MEAETETSLKRKENKIKPCCKVKNILVSNWILGVRLGNMFLNQFHQLVLMWDRTPDDPNAIFMFCIMVYDSANRTQYFMCWYWIHDLDVGQNSR